MNVKTNRSYTKAFRHDYLMILIQYHQIRIFRQLPFNFISIQKYIKYFHLTYQLNFKACDLKPYNRLDLVSWSEMSVLLISQGIMFPVKNENLGCKVRTKSNNSLQANVIFIENRLNDYTSLLQSTKNRHIHPETIIRALRIYNPDLWILHALRTLLYYIPMSFPPAIESVYDQCYNHLSLEYDLFFEKQCSNLHTCLKSKEWFTIVTITKWSTFYCRTITPVTYSITHPNKLILYTYFYCRYNHNYMFGLDALSCADNFVYRRLIRFIYRRFYCANMLIKNNNQRIYWQEWLIKTQYQIFYGYTSSMRLNIWQFRIVLRSFIIIFPTKLLLKKLSDYGICTTNGYPIVNMHWIRWNDAQIVYYFQLLYQRHYWTYSGAFNSTLNLKYAHYLIRYACAKTLAFKHKTHLNFIIQHNHAWNHMGKLHPIPVKSNSVIWHLDIN